jgi:hypothetical protein
MPVSVNVQSVHPRKLAAVRREVAPGAVGSAAMIITTMSTPALIVLAAASAHTTAYSNQRG